MTEDRITGQRADRIDHTRAGLDEVFVHSPKNVHVERMDTGRFWMRIERNDAPPIVIWFDSKRKIEATAREGD